MCARLHGDQHWLVGPGAHLFPGQVSRWLVECHRRGQGRLESGTQVPLGRPGCCGVTSAPGSLRAVQGWLSLPWRRLLVLSYFLFVSDVV